MHAGDALWKLYAIEHMLKNTEMRQCCDVIGKLIGVPPPDEQQLRNLVDQLTGQAPQQAYYADEEKPKRRSANNQTDLVNAMALLTEKMLDDVAFEWVTSGILESINEQTSREEDAFVTAKQCSAVLNIADRDEDFMATFESDYPDELRLITEHARK